MSVELKLASPVLTDREKIWEAIRRLGQFTRLDLEFKAKVYGRNGSGKIREYVVGLQRAGILETVSSGRGQLTVYRLARDKGAQAPRVRKNGTLIPASGRNRMWKAMRILGIFTTRELVAAASLAQAPVAYSEADSYCLWLCRGGYLRQNGKTWTFVKARDTGPKAPQILRIKQLYDPNLGQVVYGDEPTGRDDE